MSYLSPTINGQTGLRFFKKVKKNEELGYNKEKRKFSPSLKRFRIVRRGAMATELQYSAIPDVWLKLLTTDATNHYKAQFEVTFMLDDEFQKGNFDQIDSVLESFPIELASPELLISILSSTIPAKDHLESRDVFYRRVSKSLISRGIMETGLLDGLE